MKQIAIVFIFALILPALCFGHTGEGLHLEPAVSGITGWEGCCLDIGQLNPGGPSARLNSDPAFIIKDQRLVFCSLKTMPAGLPWREQAAPDDMISMISFLWARMFGGVDIVARTKEFVWELRSRSSRKRTARVNREDKRSRWNLVAAYRVDDQFELAARFKSRGSLFGEGGMALQVKALDPRTDEVGLIMSYKRRLFP